MIQERNIAGMIITFEKNHRETFYKLTENHTTLHGEHRHRHSHTQTHLDGITPHQVKVTPPPTRSYRLTSNNPSARHGKLPFESLVSRMPKRLPEECRPLPLSLVASHNLKARLNRCVLQIQDLKESSCLWPGSLLLKDQALLFHDVCSGSQGRETINTPSSTEKPTEEQ